MKTDSDDGDDAALGSLYNDIRCTYTAEFPVDEWDRLGGPYSLADVPVVRHKTLTREGFLFARNEDGTHYHVRDAAKNFTRWVTADAIDRDGGAPASSHAVASGGDTTGGGTTVGRDASRSSVKGKKIHNRYDGTNLGRHGEINIYRRLSVGLPKDLDDFLTARSAAIKISKAEILRKLLRAEIQKSRWAEK